MRIVNVGKANPLQLQDIRKWDNHDEWARFRKRYHPLLRQCCWRFKLDAAASDEVCRETWIEVTNRMDRLVYDPSHAFAAGSGGCAAAVLVTIEGTASQSPSRP